MLAISIQPYFTAYLNLTDELLENHVFLKYSSIFFLENMNSKVHILEGEQTRKIQV